MIKNNNLKKILWVFSLLFLVPYLIISETYSFFFTNFLGSIKLISYFISIILVFSSLRWEWLNSLILGTDFIGGTYEGESDRITDDPNRQQVEYNKITIFQTLLSTEISGCSFFNNNQNAEYNGILIDNNNKSCKFFVKIITTHIERSGIIELNFRDKDNIVGFGTSIEISGSTKWRFKLRKIDNV